MKSNLLRYGLAFFMFVAGVNHFIHPLFYYPLIPDYLKHPELINFGAGVLEVIFALMLLSATFRTYAAYGIILLLLLFVPSHIYFIQIGGCIPDGLCTPQWVAWIRLLLIHPLLIYWAWSIRN